MPDYGICFLVFLGAFLVGAWFFLRAIWRSINSQSRPAPPTGLPPGVRLLTSKYRGLCRRCALPFSEGTMIHWEPGTSATWHVDCEAAIARHRSVVVSAAIEKVEAAKGPASRRNAVAAALAKLPPGPEREQFLLEASRIEVSATLDKVDGLKTAAAKRRHLETALAALKADEVPDELQKEELGWLEDALRALDQ